MSTKGYNFPQCLDDSELGMAENILDFHPEFVLQASQLIILEDRSSHLNFCIDKTGDNDLTGKSLSEALIFASTNPQYYDRLFIELQVQYMKDPSSNLGTT